MRVLALLWAAVCLAAALPAAAGLPVRHIEVNGATLAYVELGQGEPMVLVHGGMQDYRLWAPHMATLAKHFHVIAYSRRNHYPNAISPDGWPDTAADLHAQDLAALISALRLGPVHLVAHSSGAHAALFMTETHPELVRSLVVNEPPASGLLTSPGGAAAARAFSDLLAPSREAFRRGDLREGVRLFTDVVSGPGAFEQRTATGKSMLMDNAVAHQADAVSTRARPVYTCAMAGRIRVPVLITNGERSPGFFHLVTDELARCIGQVKRATLPASHGVPLEAPAAFDKAVLDFVPAVHGR